MKRNAFACAVLASVLLAGCADNTSSTSVVVPPVVTQSTTEDSSTDSDTNTEPPESESTEISGEESDISEAPVDSVPSTTESETPIETTDATSEQTSTLEEKTTPTPEAPAEPVDVSYDRAFFSDDLFIGDSILTGLYLYNKIDMQNVAAAVGYTPYKAYTSPIDLYDGSSMTAVDYAILRQPKRIYVMIGANGIASASAMESSYRNMLELLREGCPNSEIFCISLTPVTADTDYISLNNEIISDFNTYIESLCGVYDFTYVDFYSKVVDSNGYFSKSYAEIDGFHFKGGTYDLLLNTVQKVASSD